MRLWFVYEIMDGDTCVYVGVTNQPNGRRAGHACSGPVCRYAMERLRDGVEIHFNIVAEFWDRDAAYAHEAERITWHPGGLNTCGAVKGELRGGWDIPYEPWPIRRLKRARPQVDMEELVYEPVSDGWEMPQVSRSSLRSGASFLRGERYERLGCTRINERVLIL